MSKEYIIKISDGLYDDQTGMIVFKPEIIGELIRCENCRYWKDSHDYECPHHTSGDPYIDDDGEPNDYCSSGKRKDDAETVRHGEWIPQYTEEWRTAPMGYACSLCGKKVFMGLIPLNYCPYCGAIMDSKEEENGTD